MVKCAWCYMEAWGALLSLQEAWTELSRRPRLRCPRDRSGRRRDDLGVPAHLQAKPTLPIIPRMPAAAAPVRANRFRTPPPSDTRMVSPATPFKRSLTIPLPLPTLASPPPLTQAVPHAIVPISCPRLALRADRRLPPTRTPKRPPNAPQTGTF